MAQKITLTLTPKQATDSGFYTGATAKLLGVKQSDIALLRIVKRSVDARRGALKVNLTLEAFLDFEPMPDPIHFEYPQVGHCDPVIIIGAGPAGLFAALRLIELGRRPIIFERGKDVAARGKDIAQIQRGGVIDPDSNYAFGEGGAGTFSDGKLFTRSKKRGDYNRALQRLVYHGATEEILYEAHPHIGSDRLPRIIADIRRQIVECGGEIHFGARVTGIIIKKGRAVGVEVGEQRVEGSAVVIATGHSARDIYTMLDSSGVRLEAKPFAMGVRIEHPQWLINKIQYHNSEQMEYLPAASYSLVEQVAGRGVYSFCMCPGGFIVPAMTDETESVVNGMSPSHRGSPFANSGFVTEIRAEDFAHLTEQYGQLAGLEFQRQFEVMARAEADGRQTAPAQRVADFVAGRNSATLPSCSYVPGVVPSRLDRWMPDFIADRLREAIRIFDRRMKGYLTNEALVVGVESRTSTPVRIPRDKQTLCHPDVEALYPAGEGAGYAGGIISAALDGERIAEAIVLTNN
ncbi:MAG: NAD(P)/FAD-dependent oxidoreductase [Alistipes sp.]|nr:NAD(P)/FAD-dependent oxidoreductase [Alistipes sp.]